MEEVIRLFTHFSILLKASVPKYKLHNIHVTQSLDVMKKQRRRPKEVDDEETKAVKDEKPHKKQTTQKNINYSNIFIFPPTSYGYSGSSVQTWRLHQLRVQTSPGVEVHSDWLPENSTQILLACVCWRCLLHQSAAAALSTPLLQPSHQNRSPFTEMRCPTW